MNLQNVPLYHPNPVHRVPEPPIKPRLGGAGGDGRHPGLPEPPWTIPEGQFDHFLIQYKNGTGNPRQ